MKDELIKSIGIRLRIARKSAGYKAKDFAKILDIPLSTYSQHETAKRMLTLDSLFLYCEKLNIRAAWLLTGEGGPCDEVSDYADLIKNEANKMIQAGELLATVTPFIQSGEFSNVNVLLLKRIFSIVFPIFKEVNDDYISNKLIDFCFELYNKVIGLENVSSYESEFIIKACFESFLSGTTAIQSKIDIDTAVKNVINFS